MKDLLIAAGVMAGIIGVRMALSLAGNEQVAEMFCRMAVAIIFFYYVIKIGAKRKKRMKLTATKETAKE